MKRSEALAAMQCRLEEGRCWATSVQGDSMYPFLQAGDRILVQGARLSQLGLGDLIAFRQGGNLVVHRFAGRVNRSGTQWLRQKGDNLRGHGLIPADTFAGRVVWVERSGARRFLLRGRERAWNRLRGLRALAACWLREAAGAVFHRLRGKSKGSRPGQPLSPEPELLILATRLELSPAQEARAVALLAGKPRWPALLDQAARFGMLPLLHHHLSRPALAALVPEEAKAALAAGYYRTSLRNLRILELLRRFLLKADAAGVPVLLLKGAFLARWLYRDVGLRPMGDLDLLCRKADEPAIRSILEGMGGFQSAAGTGPEPCLGPERLAVCEKVGHGWPWWFPDRCRIEIHYHLLAGDTLDDGWLLESIWANALVHDWEGLQVRSLGPEHQVLHLASHLHHHLDSGSFNLFWVADIREVLRLHRGTLDGPAMAAQARRLGLASACAGVLGMLGEPWGSEGESRDGAAAIRRCAARMHSALKTATAGQEQRSLAGYLRTVRGARHLHGFWPRVRFLRDLVFPPPGDLARRYRNRNRLILPLLYLLHPCTRIFLGLRGTMQNVQRRLRY